MNRAKIFWAFAFILFFTNSLYAQRLKPGFDKKEYTDLMHVSARFGDSTYFENLPLPTSYQFVYRSEVMGLDNCWDLWMREDNVAVLSIRGTTESSDSWLANFYAAMIPAQGVLKVAANTSLTYDFSSHPRAAVHVGWSIGTSFLLQDILPKMDSLYQAGTGEFVIIGHSQGGALAYLITSALHRLMDNEKIPSDIRLKTYASAAPKPGNLYFAYDFERMTANGWAFNVVNSADWVPEVPISIQTIDDFNVTNPFVGAKDLISQQSFPTNVALRKVYNNLTKPTKKAQRNYQKYLGDLTSKLVQNTLPGFQAPNFYHSNDYVRTGQTILLFADEEYMQNNPDNPEKVFTHHFHHAYLELTAKLPTPFHLERSWIDATIFSKWELEYVADPEYGIDISKLSRKPFIHFEEKGQRISGNTGCNFFNGGFDLTGNELSISSDMGMTKMYCMDSGEEAFIRNLLKTDKVLLSDNKLYLFQGDRVLMRFRMVLD